MIQILKEILLFIKEPDNLKIIVPGLVLTLKIVMKLLIGRRTEPKHYFELLYELPTDIVFLAFSFSLIYFFLDSCTLKSMALIPTCIVVVAAFVIAIFRECRFISEGKLTGGKIALVIILIAINYLLSLTCLYFTSNNLLSEKKEIITEQPLKK